MNYRAILIGTILAIGAAIPAKAQVVIEMSLITCKQYMASDSERQELIASWMSGYFSASKNLSVVDFGYVERNRKVVGAYCKKHPGERLMSAIQKNAR